jgi:SAM-dependent methyltransferase
MRAYWDFDSRSWDDRLANDWYRQHLSDVADWLSTRVPEHGDVVDLGCGTGNYALELGRRGFRVTGLDFAAQPLERAEQKRVGEDLGSVRFQQGDLTEPLPFPDASFDAALALYSTQMFDARPLFAEMARILRPGGAFIVETPAPTAHITHRDLDAPLSHRAFFRFKEALIAFDKRVGLIKLRSAPEVSDLLVKAGFAVDADHSNESSVVLIARREGTP